MFSGCPYVICPILVKYFQNAWREFLQTKHKIPLRLRDGVIRIWRQKVKVTVTSQIKFLTITKKKSFANYDKFHANV